MCDRLGDSSRLTKQEKAALNPRSPGPPCPVIFCLPSCTASLDTGADDFENKSVFLLYILTDGTGWKSKVYILVSLSS